MNPGRPWNRNLIIIGASARSAALSALRSGFVPWCADLFADMDLNAVAPAIPVSAAEFPSGFVNVIRNQAPLAPVLFTGGLENHPEVCQDLAKLRRVWGYLRPPSEGHEGIRDPFYLDSICRASALKRPMSRAAPCDIPVDGSWLVKPRAGGGGRGIARWCGQELQKPERYYFQALVEGESISAVFVHDAEETRLLGATRQLVGEDFLHAPSEFAYCGNVGPLDMPERQKKELKKIGKLLA